MRGDHPSLRLQVWYSGIAGYPVTSTLSVTATEPKEPDETPLERPVSPDEQRGFADPVGPVAPVFGVTQGKLR